MVPLFKRLLDKKTKNKKKTDQPNVSKHKKIVNEERI